jgi:membrane protein DedA with SNARE-associated domain
VEQTLLDWLTRFGTPVLFFAQVLGIVGLPFPDELLLAVAGALVHRGVFHAAPTLAATIGGCLTGITLSYLLGRFVGLPILLTRLRLPAYRVSRAQEWFRRFGGWLLAFGYFVPGVRHVSAIAAGSTALDYPRFAGYSYPGGVLWCSVFLGLGYVAGDRWRDVASMSGARLRMVALIVGSLVALYFVIRTVANRSATR